MGNMAMRLSSIDTSKDLKEDSKNPRQDWPDESPDWSGFACPRQEDPEAGRIVRQLAVSRSLHVEGVQKWRPTTVKKIGVG